MMSGSSRSFTSSLKVKRTPRSPTFSELAILVQELRYRPAPSVPSFSKLQITSSGVTGAAVGKGCFGAQVKFDPSAFRIGFDRFGQQPVKA